MDALGNLPLQAIYLLLGLVQLLEGLLDRLDRLAGAVQSQLPWVARLQPVRQRPGRVHGPADVDLLEPLLQRLAGGVGAGDEPLGRLYGAELGWVEHQLLDRVDRRELEDRHVELLAPLPHGTERLRGEAAAFHRAGGHLPRGTEPHPVEGELLHHQLLFRQRLRVELEADLVSFDQVATRLEGVRDLERGEVDRGLPGQEVELPHVHLGAEQLGARLFGGVPRDRLRKEDHQHREDAQEQQQRADRFPAEDFDAHSSTRPEEAIPVVDLGRGHRLVEPGLPHPLADGGPVPGHAVPCREEDRHGQRQPTHHASQHDGVVEVGVGHEGRVVPGGP